MFGKLSEITLSVLSIMNNVAGNKIVRSCNWSIYLFQNVI